MPDNKAHLLYFNLNEVAEEIGRLKFLGVVADDTARDELNPDTNDVVVVAESDVNQSGPAFYLYNGTTWVIIDLYNNTTSISLSGYYTANEVDDLIADFTTASDLTAALGDYVLTTALTTALGDYYSKTASDARYYQKSELYTQTEVDALIDGLDISALIGSKIAAAGYIDIGNIRYAPEYTLYKTPSQTFTGAGSVGIRKEILTSEMSKESYIKLTSGSNDSLDPAIFEKLTTF